MVKKYKEGDIVVRKRPYNDSEDVVRIISGYSFDRYDVLSASGADEYDLVDISAKSISRIYDGVLKIREDIWEPKYSIGDSILVYNKDFGDIPTWHPIYSIHFKDHSFLGDYKNFKRYAINAQVWVGEENVLDVIRYGETVTTTESKK